MNADSADKPERCYDSTGCRRLSLRLGGFARDPIGFCSEFKNCGRQPGGRACWVVAGSLCGGKIQGTHAQKLNNCWRCDFFNVVKNQEEPSAFGFDTHCPAMIGVEGRRVVKSEECFGCLTCISRCRTEGAIDMPVGKKVSAIKPRLGSFPLLWSSFLSRNRSRDANRNMAFEGAVSETHTGIAEEVCESIKTLENRVISGVTFPKIGLTISWTWCYILFYEEKKTYKNFYTFFLPLLFTFPVIILS